MCISADFSHYWCLKCDTKEHLTQDEIDEIREIMEEANQPVDTKIEREHKLSPAEQEAAKKRRERSDKASAKMGEYLLSGWTMLAEHCQGTLIRMLGSVSKKTRRHQMSRM